MSAPPHLRVIDGGGGASLQPDDLPQPLRFAIVNECDGATWLVDTKDATAYILADLSAEQGRQAMAKAFAAYIASGTSRAEQGGS